MLAAIQLDIDTNVWTVVLCRQEDDLPKELTGSNLLHLKGKYDWGYVVVEGTRNVGIEYINNKWYYLELDRQTGAYITKEGLALTNEQLIQHGLSCTVQPPETNILTARESSEVPAEDEGSTPTKGKEPVTHNSSDDKDLYLPARGPPRTPINPIPPEEEAFLSAGLEHVATLKHADHPEEEITHLRPHLTNIRLAVQEGLPIPTHPPRMTTVEEV